MAASCCSCSWSCSFCWSSANCLRLFSAASSSRLIFICSSCCCKSRCICSRDFALSCSIFCASSSAFCIFAARSAAVSVLLFDLLPFPSALSNFFCCALSRFCKASKRFSSSEPPSAVSKDAFTSFSISATPLRVFIAVTIRLSNSYCAFAISLLPVRLLLKPKDWLPTFKPSFGKLSVGIWNCSPATPLLVCIICPLR